MIKYFLKRIMIALFTILSATVVVFIFIHLLPGDPIKIMLGSRGNPEIIDRLNKYYEFDKPLIQQYLTWLWKLFQGNWGISVVNREEVKTLLLRSIGPTIALSIGGVLVSSFIGISGGVIAALKKNTWKEYAITIFTYIGIAIPEFFLAILLILIFAMTLKILPPAGYITFNDSPIEFIKRLILPSFSLGLPMAAIIARMTRSEMLDILDLDYILTAKAKGVFFRDIVLRHALPNMILPIITIIGLQFGYMLGGSVIIENIFAIPGVGRLTINAVLTRDYPIVQAGLLFYAVVFTLVTLFVDYIIFILDPRVRSRL